MSFVHTILDELHGTALFLDLEALSPPHRKAVVARRDQFDRGMRRVIQEGCRSGVFARCDAKLMSFAILGAVNWIPRWFNRTVLPPARRSPTRSPNTSWTDSARYNRTHASRHQPDATPGPREPKPEWLKVRAPGSPSYLRLKSLMREPQLHTVCEEAQCPNIGECWNHGTATFMILGDVCTRACSYCAVAHGRPGAVDTAEPERVANAIQTLGLNYVVITSVDRDDLADGGASIFAETIRQTRRRLPSAGSRCSSPTSRATRRRSMRCSTHARTS